MRLRRILWSELMQFHYCNVSRTVLSSQAPQKHLEILQPVNLELLVKRNLAASWFTKIPGVEVKGLLKSMNVSL